MFFEAPVLFFLLLAFLPRRLVAWGLPSAVRHRRWLALPMVPFAILLGMGVREPWALIPLVILLELLAALAFVAAYGHGGARGRLAHLSFAALPVTLIPFIFGPGRFFEGARGANVWFLDYVNKLFIAWVEPLLDLFGLGARAGEVLALLAPSLEAVSRGLPALYYSLELLFVPSLYALLSRWVPTLPRGGPGFEGSLPRWLGVAAILVWVGLSLAPAPWPLRLLGHLVWGAFFAFGLARMSQGLRAMGLGEGPGSVVLTILALALVPAAAWMPVVAGVLDALFGFHSHLHRLGDPRHTPAEEALGAVLARRWGPVMAILGVLLPLKLVAGPVLSLSRAPGTNGPALTASGSHPERVALRGSGIAFSVDRYEAPSIHGAPPLTGRTPAEAEAWCRARERRLCTEERWAQACSLGGDRYYINGGWQAERGRALEVSERCNLGAVEGEVRPSGAHGDCVNPAGVADMPGNAWEWVALDHRPGWWGLSGGYFRYDDEQTPSCAFRILVHEAQLPVLNLDTIGFRCCG